MRYLILILVLFATVNSQAQLKSYRLTAEGDTLNRIDINNLKQGAWIEQVPELRGERGYEEEGWYVNGQKEGVWKRYSLEGDVLAVERYRFGMKDGKCIYFTNAGVPMREESWRAIDPKNPYDTVNVYDINDPSKIIRKEIVKVEPKAYKHGTWTYIDPEDGAIVKTEEWVMNREKVPESEKVEDDMAPIDVVNGTSTEKKEVKKVQTKPKEVLEFEKKNSGKKKIKVRDGSTGG